MRDRVRFHRFESGCCSCKDYWWALDGATQKWFVYHPTSSFVGSHQCT
jgi:hypothetical protein